MGKKLETKLKAKVRSLDSETPTADEIQRVTEYLRSREVVQLNERFEKKFNDSMTIPTYQGIDLMDDRISKEAILGIIQEERRLDEHRNN